MHLSYESGGSLEQDLQLPPMNCFANADQRKERPRERERMARDRSFSWIGYAAMNFLIEIFI